MKDKEKIFLNIYELNKDRIYRIAIHTSINFTRILKREHRHRIDSDKIYINEPDNHDETGEDLEAQIRLLYKSIAKLSIAERTIISLVIEDLSYKEISEICSISEGALRVRIHRIKRKYQ